MFYPEALDFLSENCFMNSKAWFETNKHKYKKYVQEPLAQLHNYLASTVEDIDSQINTVPRSCISRIYRDLRFSKSQLYRDMLWISFRRDRKEFVAWPEFYFIISPQTFFYGCGYYCTKAPVMAQIRKMVLEDHPLYLRARAAYESCEGAVLDGDTYKRSRFANEAEEKRLWLDRKTIRFTVYPHGEELFSEGLAEKIKEAFIALAPIYEFFIYAEQQASE